jgi:signal transduction histidine kinase
MSTSDHHAPATPEPATGVAGVVRDWTLTATGLFLGALTALAEVFLLACAGVVLAPVAAWPGARRALIKPIFAGTRLLTEIERARLERLLGSGHPAGYDDRRALVYLAVRSPVGLLGGLVLALLAWGAGTAAAVAVAWALGRRPDGIEPTFALIVYFIVVGVLMLFLVLQGIQATASLDRTLARRFLGPSPRELLERRISELSVSRAGIMEAVDQERRRIERDLHDGVQQRLVALGLLIGRARRARSAEHGEELLRQAHEASQRLLGDLREVAWRVYPTALDALGLEEALAGVAEHSGVPVRIRYDLGARPGRQVETAAYFVVSEAVTNAAKHSGAGLITVELARADGMVVVRVDDDGTGGADPSGGGLSGLARRVAALDGRFRVQSPPGGPTTIVAELPCE